MKLTGALFLCKNFFLAILTVVTGFVFGFFFPVMTDISKFALFAVVFIAIADGILLYINRTGVSGMRLVSEKLSNADQNKIKINLQNHFPFLIRYKILDEIPEQFQIFDFKITGTLSGHRTAVLDYELFPKERGLYEFGKTNVFIKTPLGFLERRIVLDTKIKVRVYPSFLKLNQYSLKNFKASTYQLGQRKVRRIGHSMEFEQIKKYVAGDDYRTINWKSTAKNQTLMVNQYVDERSQQIYCAIDKGRVMKMPFEEMTLLDYAVNASLIFSNIVLQNHDRVGMFTFSNGMEDRVKAERRNNQLRSIQEKLYGITTDFKESDFGLLYNSIRHQIRQRSLIILFTNFESLDALNRQLPYLIGINKIHLLITVFFENTELEDFLIESNSISDPYQKAVVEKFVYEKRQIVLELRKHGIQTILTRPENLTIDTINKYLEIKSRGMI